MNCITMDTYLLLMYVTQEQESAIHAMFVDKHWIFCKADPDKLTSSRKVVYQFDSLDQTVPTVYTESNVIQKNVTLFGDLNADIPELHSDRNAVTDVNVSKIELSYDNSTSKAESNLEIPDMKLKECFVNLERISAADIQNLTTETPELVNKKRGRGRISYVNDTASVTTVKKLKKASGLKVRTLVNKRESKDYKIKNANAKRDSKSDIVTDVDTAKSAIDSDIDDKSKNVEDDTAARSIDPEPLLFQANGDPEDEIRETEDVDEDVDDDSDYCVDGEDSLCDKASNDPDYGTKLKKKKKVRKDVFKCENCNKTYKFEIAYKKHLEKNCIVKKKLRKVDENSGHGEFKCATCKKVYTYKRKYVKHIVDGVCRFQCKYCGKVIRGELPRHIFHKHETEQERLRCGVCKKRLYDKGELRDHMLVHSNVKNYVCDQCGKAFFTPVSLYVHRKQHDKISPKPQCEICSKVFNTASSLWYHRSITHSDVRDCVCEICGKRFKTNRCVRTHMRMHSDARPYHCDVCGKNYKYVHQLYTHKRIFHTKIQRFFCSVCNKGFYFENLLKDHMNIHMGVKAHTCEQCSYTSYTRVQMTQHRRKHRKPKNVSVEPAPNTSGTLLDDIPVLD